MAQYKIKLSPAGEKIAPDQENSGTFRDNEILTLQELFFSASGGMKDFREMKFCHDMIEELDRIKEITDGPNVEDYILLDKKDLENLDKGIKAMQKTPPYFYHGRRVLNQLIDPKEEPAG